MVSVTLVNSSANISGIVGLMFTDCFPEVDLHICNIHSVSALGEMVIEMYVL